MMAEQRATNATLVQANRPMRTITCAHLDEAVMGALLMHFIGSSDHCIASRHQRL